jgi:hypothetical protein
LHDRTHLREEKLVRFLLWREIVVGRGKNRRKSKKIEERIGGGESKKARGRKKGN